MTSSQHDLSPVNFLAPILSLREEDLGTLSILSVAYPAANVDVSTPGKTLAPAELVPLKGAAGLLPHVRCSAGLKDDASYHLAFFDPDAPEDPTKNGPFGDWQWLVLGLTKGDLTNDDPGDQAKTFVANQVMAHDGPNPPAGEAKHRYVLVLFEGVGEVSKPAGAPKSWLFKKFVDENKSSLRPVGLNFYFAEQ
uniref:Phosphatidylethanolamine-binding protein n=1 Tax=Pseudictyota dubia TaxID=2749911 RepID=A0A7R9WG80_9STRA|mmetsp:Transcript_46628/g.86589  ORF Transcript_46628/g.86589 Transcript_46628/m.86589 type:complete len:194 (+) Transcript_46628:165-746(+)